MKITRIVKKNNFLYIFKDDKELFCIRNVKVDKSTIYLEFIYEDSENIVLLNPKDYAKVKGVTSFQQGRHKKTENEKSSFKKLTEAQKEINKKIAKKLKNYRIKKGLTRQDIQKEIATGYNFICKLERGKSQITRDNILTLTKMYEKEPNVCLSLLEQMEQLNGTSSTNS